MPIAYDDSGLAHWQDRLANLQQHIQDAVAQALLAEIAAGWSAQSPSQPGEAPAIDTGMLAASILYDGARLGSDVSYGAALEYGTLTLAARPWLRPAVERVRQRLSQIIRQVMEEQQSHATRQKRIDDPFGSTPTEL